MRLIDADALIERLKDGYCAECDIRDGSFCVVCRINTAINGFNDAPTIDAAPVVHGQWIFDIDNKEWSWNKPYICDQCGGWVEKAFKCCPNCGAKMDGGEDK